MLKYICTALPVHLTVHFRLCPSYLWPDSLTHSSGRAATTMPSKGSTSTTRTINRDNMESYYIWPGANKPFSRSVPGFPKAIQRGMNVILQMHNIPGSLFGSPWINKGCFGTPWITKGGSRLDRGRPSYPPLFGNLASTAHLNLYQKVFAIW